jgi:hypothetical protein
MMKLKYRLFWVLFTLVTLAGCEGVKGTGRGLDGLLRGITLPLR